jgi:MFS family permease
MVFGCRRLLLGRLPRPNQSGAMAIGTALSAGWLRLDGSRALLRGSLLFLVGVVGMALSPWYGLAFVLLLMGGLGTAAFSTMETTLILVEAPVAMRSRVMGIVTMCIGTGPLGVLAAGMLSEWLGPASAVLIMAGFGLAGLGLVWTRLLRGQA